MFLPKVGNYFYGHSYVETLYLQNSFIHLEWYNAQLFTLSTSQIIDVIPILEFSAHSVKAALIFGNPTQKTFGACNSVQYAANRNLLRCLVPILEFFTSTYSVSTALIFRNLKYKTSVTHNFLQNGANRQTGSFCNIWFQFGSFSLIVEAQP